MCGLAGLSLQHHPVGNERLQRMASTLAHRGPDERGTYVHEDLGLAHTRLSIIDLGHGHQPLFAQGGQLALIANGEIYNYVELRQELEQRGHRFATHSDSEVILYAYLEYGENFLRHLHGMFAFALHDKARGRLVLARDRLGIKPLFLARLTDGIAFASELKALLPALEGKPQLDPVGLGEYLQNQFSTGRTTVLRNVERVLPGEALYVEHGRITKRWRYWSALEVRPESMSFDEAQQRFDGVMETVMREHMRSDVPFGLFLSGGVDSAILLALLTRYGSEPVRTFTVGFAEAGMVDEVPLAAPLAAQFGSRHTEVRPNRNDIFLSLPHTVWAADELMRDYASMPTALLAQAAGAELKVVFSGEGGDEAFAGYGRYRSSPLERWFKRLLAPGTGGFRTRGTFRGSWPRKLFNETLLAAGREARQPFVDAWKATPKGWSDLQRMQYVDLTTALPDNLMVKGDRMLMGWGVEGRVPFLDHRVVEFGLSLPDHLKIEGGQGKAFLKHWASRFLPKEALFARKRGFHVPIGHWLQGEYREQLRRVLPEHPAIQTWFRPAGVAELLAHCGSSGSVNRMVWSLLQFAVWHQLFIEGDGQRPPARLDPLDLIAP